MRTLMLLINATIITPSNNKTLKITKYLKLSEEITLTDFVIIFPLLPAFSLCTSL